MTKTTGKKIKGNKDDVKHFIDFYDTDFFGIVDDKNKKTTSKTMHPILYVLPYVNEGLNKISIWERASEMMSFQRKFIFWQSS